MKKTILLLAAATTLFVGAQAQPYKQAGGEKNLQLLFNPWGGNNNSPISLNDNAIMFRKFNATGTAAWRLGFSISSTKNTDVIVQPSDTDNVITNYEQIRDAGFYKVNRGLNPQGDERNSTFAFSIRPGYEKHFAGTDRLSPYIGAELVFRKSSTKTSTDNIIEGNYTVTYYDTATVDPTVSAPWSVLETNSKIGSTTFGLNLIAGFDFYFAKNISLGAELNFGYQTTSFSDRETEYVDNSLITTDAGTFPNSNHTDVNSSSVKSAPDQKQGSLSGFGPGVTGLIKLGWLF